MREILSESLLDGLVHPLPDHVLQLHGTLRKGGFACHLVGGCVRDLLLGRRVQDVDITTDARPETVMQLFRRTVPTGLQHGTVTVILDGHPYEVTTYRTESTYSDGRRPDAVAYAQTIEEDLSRRDFTINALAYEPLTRELIDEYDGRGDLERRIIRTIGHPEERFFEDGLRPVRACRFRSSLGFDIHEDTHTAMLREDVRQRMQGVAMERFADELGKGFKAPHPSRMLDALQEARLFDIFLPGVRPVSRRFFEYIDCFPDPIFRMALWLDRVVADPRRALLHLRSSGALIKKVGVHLEILRALERGATGAVNPPFWRRLAAIVKKELREEAPTLFETAVPFFQHSAYVLDQHSLLADAIHLKEASDSIRHSLVHHPLLVTDLMVGGNDLLQMGLKGPEVGKHLAVLLDLVLEEPARNERENLLNHVRMQLQRAKS